MELLSESVQHEIRARITNGAFTSADDVVTTALRLLDEQLALESELLEGLDSGSPIEYTSEVKAAIRKRFENRFGSDSRFP